MNNKANKIIVITGGSSGIGKAFAKAYNAKGNQVIACGRDVKKLEQLKADIPGIDTFQCDVTDKASLHSFAEYIEAKYPCVDVLISNAGRLDRVNFSLDDLSQFDASSQINLNLTSSINVVATFMPQVKKSDQGNIVLVSSGFGLSPAGYAPLYSAAKAGIHSFAKSLRHQLKEDGILVTEVIPPLVDTPATQHRTEAKISAETVVTTTLRAIEKGKDEVLVGQTKFLPIIMRLAPRAAEKLVFSS